MKRLRIYLDTSVIGGCLDVEFALESTQLIENIKQQKITLLLGELVINELIDAPLSVQEILKSIPPATIEVINLTEEIIQLRDAYIQGGVVNQKSLNDAGHVATATVVRADAIVSWNFKHIVRLDKMKAYNQINLLNGYGILTIVSPKEVILDEFNSN